MNWLIGIRPNYRGIMQSPKPQGHGGEGETSRMLAAAPDLVRMDLATPYHPDLPDQAAVHGDYLPYLGGAIGRHKLPPRVFRGFTDGITGDPQLATVEVGEKIYGLITDWIAAAIKEDMRSADRP